MNTQILSLKRFPKLVDALLEHRWTVVGPRRTAAGLVAPGRIEAGEDFDTHFPDFWVSPKSLLLPQREVLCRLESGQASEPETETGQTVLIGLRPCDAAAIAALDRVFLATPPGDPYYASRRERLTLVVLACLEPESYCFCTSVGGGPAAQEAADVMLYRLEADLLLKPVTPRGERLLSQITALLGDADPRALERAEQLAAVCAEKMNKVDIQDLPELLGRSFEHENWAHLGQTCLGCGACSFLCPTCHCFDMGDEVRAGRGQRLRAWDTCAFPQFTMHASGHNPRPSRRERWRQRAMHKFKYSVENLGRGLCVGCGRCIRACPVHIDLRTVLKAVRS